MFLFMCLVPLCVCPSFKKFILMPSCFILILFHGAHIAHNLIIIGAFLYEFSLSQVRVGCPHIMCAV